MPNGTSRFFVDPAASRGLAQGLGAVGTALLHRQQQQEFQEEITGALESRDPQQVMDLMLKYPQMSTALESYFQFSGEQTRQDMADTAFDVIRDVRRGGTGLGPVEGRVGRLQALGLDSTQTAEGLDLAPQELEQMAMLTLAEIDPDRLKALQTLEPEEDVDFPAAVKETQWFLKQSKPVQDLHLKVKRGTQLSPEEKIYYRQELAKADLQAERPKEQLKGYDAVVSSGIEAVDSLPNLQRSLDLLQKVKTGGLEETKLLVQDYLGTTPADLGELRSLLGQNILGNIKALGSNPTEGERDFIKSISASIGQGNEVNERQLKRLLREAERQKRRAIRAYELRAEKGFDDPFAAELLGITPPPVEPVAPVTPVQPAPAPPPMLQRLPGQQVPQRAEEPSLDELLKQYGVGS